MSDPQFLSTNSFYLFERVLTRSGNLRVVKLVFLCLAMPVVSWHNSFRLCYSLISIKYSLIQCEQSCRATFVLGHPSDQK